MIPRSTLIAVLIGVEVAILVGMVGSFRGFGPETNPWTPSAGGPEPAQRTFSFLTGPGPAGYVDVGDADVDVEPHELPSVEVAEHHVGFSLGGGRAPVVSATDTDGTIRVTRGPVTGSVFTSWESKVRLIVPPGTRLTVAHAGSIDVRGLRAAASLNSDDGSIIVHDFQGDLAASSSNGRIEVTDASGASLHADASNGRIVLTNVAAQHVDLISSNGRIEGTGLRLRDGIVSSSNGRVSLHFAAGTDATITASASNGGVSVTGLPAAGGVAPARSSDDDDDDDDDSRGAKTVRIGSGAGHLDVESSNGSIDITREG